MTIIHRMPIFPSLFFGRSVLNLTQLANNIRENPNIGTQTVEAMVMPMYIAIQICITKMETWKLKVSSAWHSISTVQMRCMYITCVT